MNFSKSCGFTRHWPILVALIFLAWIKSRIHSSVTPNFSETSLTLRYFLKSSTITVHLVWFFEFFTNWIQFKHLLLVHIVYLEKLIVNKKNCECWDLLPLYLNGYALYIGRRFFLLGTVNYILPLVIIALLYPNSWEFPQYTRNSLKDYPLSFWR